MTKQEQTQAEMQAETDAEEVERLFTLKELKALTKLSRSSIYRHIEQGNLAQPKKWGRSSRWTESDVMEWFKTFARGLNKSINPKARTQGE